MHTCMHACTHARMHARARAHTHTHTHTCPFHTPANATTQYLLRRPWQLALAPLAPPPLARPHLLGWLFSAHHSTRPPHPSTPCHRENSFVCLYIIHAQPRTHTQCPVTSLCMHVTPHQAQLCLENLFDTRKAADSSRAARRLPPATHTHTNTHTQTHTHEVSEYAETDRHFDILGLCVYLAVHICAYL